MRIELTDNKLSLCIYNNLSINISLTFYSYFFFIDHFHDQTSGGSNWWWMLVMVSLGVTYLARLKNARKNYFVLFFHRRKRAPQPLTYVSVNSLNIVILKVGLVLWMKNISTSLPDVIKSMFMKVTLPSSVLVNILGT